ncbi:hypothetical protein C1645_757118, partial [Glomus cerebriforme]
MDHLQNNLGDNVHSYNNEFSMMNDNDNNNYQQFISDDISNNNVTISPDHTYQFNNVSNESDVISPDNNYQQYDALSNISFNDSSNEHVNIFPDHYHQQYNDPNNISLNNSQQFMSNYYSNENVNVCPDHYQYNDISFNNSQQYVSNGTPNDSVTDQQCNDVIPPYNYQQFMHVDQNPPQLPSINITINPSQVSEIFRSGFKIVFMPITNSD